MKKWFLFTCFILLFAIFGGFFVTQNAPVVATDNSQAFYDFEKQLMQVAKNDDLDGISLNKTDNPETVRQKIKNIPQVADSIESNLSDGEVQVDWNSINHILERNGYYSVEVGNQISIYHKYSLKRLIVFGDVSNTYGAYQVINGYDDIKILCYRTQEQTQRAYNQLINENVDVYADKVMTADSYSQTAYDYSDNLNWGAKTIDIGGYNEYLTDKAITTSEEMVVVVVDTGLNTSHSFFANRMLKDGQGNVVGYSYYTTQYTYSGYNFEDDQGHGTHVAGIICDLTPSNVKILPIKVLDQKGRGTSSHIISGLTRVYEIYSNTYKISCVNMSLGGGYSESGENEYSKIFTKLREKNILPIVAAGNDAKNANTSVPAACDNAITVSALREGSSGVEFDVSYSNYGEDIDISAPGSEIYSTYISHKNQAANAYATLDGTSMATPQVAGTVALLCLDPIYFTYGNFNYTADQIQQRLYDLSIDLGDKGWDQYYGHGCVNIRYFEHSISDKIITFYKDGEIVDDTIDCYIEFDSSFLLTMQCSDPTYEIYYTSDHSIPKAGIETKYTAPINIEDTIYIYAVAYKMQNGNIVEVTEVFNISFFYENGNIEDYLVVDKDGRITKYTGHFKEVIVPEYVDGIQVSEVYLNAFAYCDAVAITLPESCKSVAGYAFMSGKNLQYLYAPGVQEVFIYAFAFNQKLTFVTSDKPAQNATKGVYLPKVEESRGGAFYDCENITSVKLDNYKTPGEVDFAYCTKLETCELPNITIIPKAMFFDCPSMQTFEVCKFVQKIEDVAFGQNKLESFSIENGNSYIYTDGVGLYTTTAFVAYACAAETKDYEIKKTVNVAGQNFTIVTINSEVLIEADLDSLTIPSSIILINTHAFSNSNIGTLYYNAESCGYEGYYFKEESMVGPPFYEAHIEHVIIGENVKKVPERMFQWSMPDKITINSTTTQLESCSLYVISDEEDNDWWYDLYIEFDTIVSQSYAQSLSNAMAAYRAKNIFVKMKSSYIPSVLIRSFCGSYNEYFVYSNISKTITASCVGNGTISPAGSVAILDGGERTFTIKPANGYVIDDVKVNGKSVGAVETYTIKSNGSNQTIVATFSDRAYSIMASANNGGLISPNGKTSYKENESATYTITANIGYKIKDVLVDNISVGPVETYTFENINQSHTIEAEFEKITFTIEVVCGENGTISPTGNQVVDYGMSQKFDISADVGYKIKDVVVDGESKGAIFTYTFSDIIANHTISVTFEPIYFTINIECGENGTVTPKGLQTVVYGEDFDIEITPNTGYKIKSVIVNGESVELATSYIFENVTADKTISVQFEKITFTITVTQGLNGNISPEQVQTVEYGSSKTFTITPAIGYKIKSVYVNDENKGTMQTYTFANITSNHTISAEFEKLKFVVNIICDIGGTISPAETVVLEYGQNKTFAITPDQGYLIKDVTLDGISLGALSLYELEAISSDHTLFASFEKIKFNIIIETEGKGSVNLLNGETIDYGESAIIQFEPDPGHELKSVYINGKLVKVFGNQITIHNITESKIINVKFVEKTNITVGIIIVAVVLLPLCGFGIYMVIKRKRRMF